MSGRRPIVPAGPAGAGFTLLELLVVILILGFVGALVLMRGPARSERLQVEAAARQVSEGLRLTRSEAIASNRRVGFTVDVAGHSYAVGTARPVALPLSVGLSVTALAEETAGGRMAAISFAPDGSSSGGRIELDGAGRRALVGVDWLTGRVSVLYEN